ncbi:MAG: hypothetical protein JWO51_5150 [Rhodospirillales bacterium]|nr:hypothetical protein [Rhodospirillales bacterium]
MNAVDLGNFIEFLVFGIGIISGIIALFCVFLRLQTKKMPTILFGSSSSVWFLSAGFLSNQLFTTLLFPDSIGRLSPGLQVGVGDIFVSLACLFLAFTLNAILKRFVWYGSLSEGTQSRVPNILIALIRLAIYAGALMVIFSLVFHRDVTAIAATSGVVAIVLGYSLQPTLSEIFAGLALNLSHAFRIGDSVQHDGVWGIIQEANWRSVSMRTYEGTLVVVPNTKMATTRLTNLDLPNHNMRHHIRFIVDIDVPPGRVQSVALAAMNALPHVLKSPPAMLLFKDMTDQGVAYEAIFWHFNPNVYILRRDEVGVALWYAFRRAGIPFSVLRHNLATHADARPNVPPFDVNQYRRRLSEVLHQSPLFQCFQDDAIEQLVEHHRQLVYGPMEMVVRQDDAGTSMFVILDGAVTVLHETADGSEREVATLGTGESFGHMSLMTGATRSATVRAVGHLVLAEIEKDAIGALLGANPAAVEIIAQEIMRLDAANMRLRELEQAASTEGGQPGPLGSIAKLMRGFFLLGG